LIALAFFIYTMSRSRIKAPTTDHQRLLKYLYFQLGSTSQGHIEVVWLAAVVGRSSRRQPSTSRFD
jgi:hypothetical protein